MLIASAPERVNVLGNPTDALEGAVTKAVIPAAGLGTRLLPTTKELPKEMMPIFTKSRRGLTVKPILQIIFEELFDVGVRKFCFIVGRGKRAIEDHFTPDYDYVDYLMKRGKKLVAEELKDFYRKIEKSIIMWVNQPEPKGFGDAVLKAKAFVGNDPFIVHAGDTLVLPEEGPRIERLVKVFTERKLDAIFLLKRVKDPRMYGVIEPGEVQEDIVKVKKIVEKPEIPPSDLAVIPIYVFNPIIFKALETIPKGKRGELELTDAIQRIIEWGYKVNALTPREGQEWLDVGTPNTYWRALKLSYEAVKREI